ncbi:hypothetical protein BS47DRAFT_1353554 [Hydnum rufescens UP504]|uniref:RNA 3'-terminal phosphate cyclase-like protein n=1 Tax=Hydnum rufescens UP504 TaxID=1448309 RepID=A0A9P6DJZ9_9AGAM|nr:hypothetical protein BS47DRAFT_1353554 [Hydnum rufescens UP504]
MSLVKFTGTDNLRVRLVLSVLSGKPVRIDGIRSEDKDPGLRDYEVSMLRFLEKITNGTVIEISLTGTSVLLKPGIISGGSPMEVTLRGITSDDHDLSVDLIRTVSLPHLQLIGMSEGLEIPSFGGGEVEFLCPIIKQAKTLNFVAPGKIKRIRGISHAVRVSPQFSHRMIEASRSLLNRFIPDIYLYADVYKGEESGKSPGYALSLLAESTTSAIHCSEAISRPGVTPEEVALEATKALLTEIRRGGCIDRKHQGMVLILMLLGSEDVGRCRMGSSAHGRPIQVLRDIRDVFGTSFKIAPADAESKEVLLSCYGTGYVNSNRPVA